MSDCTLKYLDILRKTEKTECRRKSRGSRYHARRMNTNIQELNLPCCTVLGYPTCKILQCLLPWKRTRKAEMIKELVLNDWVVIELEEMERDPIVRISQPLPSSFLPVTPVRRVDIKPASVTCLQLKSTPIQSVGKTRSQRPSAELLSNLMHYDII